MLFLSKPCPCIGQVCTPPAAKQIQTKASKTSQNKLAWPQLALCPGTQVALMAAAGDSLLDASGQPSAGLRDGVLVTAH